MCQPARLSRAERVCSVLARGIWLQYLGRGCRRRNNTEACRCPPRSDCTFWIGAVGLGTLPSGYSALKPSWCRGSCNKAAGTCPGSARCCWYHISSQETPGCWGAFVAALKVKAFLQHPLFPAKAEARCQPSPRRCLRGFGLFQPCLACGLRTKPGGAVGTGRDELPARSPARPGALPGAACTSPPAALGPQQGMARAGHPAGNAAGSWRCPLGPRGSTCGRCWERGISSF